MLQFAKRIMAGRRPRVFLSYSHDSDTHRKRVLDLCQQLRDHGVDADIDQFHEDEAISWPQWMLSQIESADFVLVVCTENYAGRMMGKAARGVGRGVKWESQMITQALYEENRAKFIPVLLDDSSEEAAVPVPLRAATRYRITAAAGLKPLIRRLTNQPRVRAKSLGEIPELPPETSGPPATPLSPSGSPSGGGANRLGFSIRRLGCKKVIQADGQSDVEYVFEHLAAQDRPLARMQFRFDTKIGIVGEPRIEVRAAGPRVVWESARPRAVDGLAVESIVEAFRRVDGFIVFDPPLDPGQTADFVLRFSVLNGDATDALEFFLLYPPHNRADVGGAEFSKPTEYIFRPVWWPVDQMDLDLTIPHRPEGSLYLRHYVCATKAAPARRNGGEITYPETKLADWKFTGKSEIVLSKARTVRVQQSIRAPRIGTAVSLKWCFAHDPKQTDEMLVAEEPTKAIRAALLEARKEFERWRRNQPVGAWVEVFIKEAAYLEGLLRISRDGHFDVSVMTFDVVSGHLRIVAGVQDGRPLSPRRWNLTLRPGIGNAGACFKRGCEQLLYEPSVADPNKPSYYLPILDASERHQSLLSVPAFEASWLDGVHRRRTKATTAEARRNLVAIVNLGTTSQSSRLTSIKRDSELARDIGYQCQRLVDLVIFRSQSADAHPRADARRKKVLS